jgi:protein SCO1
MLRKLLTLSVLAHGLASASSADEAELHRHHHPEARPGFTRTVANYDLPEVSLVRADGKTVSFPKDIDDGRPVVLNFIYTTCTAICPLLSQTFAQLQRKLGSDASKVHMVSVSIDPEQDTPARLSEYAARYNAGPQWTYYTGTLAASVAVQKAFRAYYVDKMNHRPVVFMRAAPAQPWVRLDGFTSPGDLLKEYRELTAAG